MTSLCLLEAHFSGLSSQSSIYGLTSLCTKNGSHKVLAASSKRKVYCIEYSMNNNGNLIPSTREVQFTYIPGGADIISIDAFNQASHEHDFVVGITFVKSSSTGTQSQHFNIYSEWEPGSECDLDNIAQGCLSLPLDFIPFQLTHTEITDNGSKEMVWLLSGDDLKVHMYREDKSCQSFSEEPSEEFFPEFKDLTSVVLWMDFVVMPQNRITAFGCRDGNVVVFLIDLGSDVSVSSSWSIQHDGPVSSVLLFTDYKSDLSVFPRKEKRIEHEKLDFPLHLLVGNTLEVSVVYRNILKKGLSIGAQWLLPQSNKYDCVTCACVADIDMDGEYELLLGTYGQQLLVYKYHRAEEGTKGKYVVTHQQSFSDPLLAITYVDITGDGLKELLVLSTRGLHVLQHSLHVIKQLCIERLKIAARRLNSQETT